MLVSIGVRDQTLHDQAIHLNKAPYEYEIMVRKLVMVKINESIYGHRS